MVAALVLVIGCGSPETSGIERIVHPSPSAAVVTPTPTPMPTPTPVSTPGKGAAARPSRVPQAPRAQAAAPPAGSGDVWWRLALCESGGNPQATSRSGRYLGAFQFSLPTWHSVGGPGDPRQHPYETQKFYAMQLQRRSGWGQWPACSRKLGLR